MPQAIHEELAVDITECLKSAVKEQQTVDITRYLQ